MTVTVKRVVTFALGVVFLAIGIALTYVETKSPPVHSGHLWGFLGIALLGAFIIEPVALAQSVGTFTKSLGGLIVVVLEILPGRKGGAPTVNVVAVEPAAKDAKPPADPGAGADV